MEVFGYIGGGGNGFSFVYFLHSGKSYNKAFNKYCKLLDGLRYRKKYKKDAGERVVAAWAPMFPVALAAIGYTLLVHQLQEKLIYMPREYASHPQHYARVKERARAALSVRHGGALELIEYTLPEAHGGGAQTAYFLRPAVSTVIGDGHFDLWMAAGGNAGLALDWLETAVEFMASRDRPPATQAAFLLVDYPGYGTNAGEPSPQAMLAGNRAALRAPSFT